MILISGKVIKGEGYGRTLGFPTANLDRRSYSARRMKVRLGIYAGWAGVEDRSKKLEVRKYKAAIVIGPLDRNNLPKIEAHLLGFKGSLYGKSLSIYLGKYLRPFRKFKNVEILKGQIKKDIILIKKMSKN